MSFDIKFTRQGFENACWHCEACQAIQHTFSKPSLVNLISKDANLVFLLSVYPLLNTLQTSDYDVIFDICVELAIRHSKSATSSWPDKGNMPWDRKRLLGHVETIQLILGVTDKIKYHTLPRKPQGKMTRTQQNITNKVASSFIAGDHKSKSVTIFKIILNNVGNFRDGNNFRAVLPW